MRHLNLALTAEIQKKNPEVLFDLCPPSSPSFRLPVLLLAATPRPLNNVELL
jgi:hypothetical protein